MAVRAPNSDAAAQDSEAPTTTSAGPGGTAPAPPDGEASTSTPANPATTPAQTRRGCGWRRTTRVISATQTGTRDVSVATMPGGTYCTDQVSPPWPHRIRPTPTSPAAATSAGRRSSRPPPRQAHQASRMAPATTKREPENRNGGTELTPTLPPTKAEPMTSHTATRTAGTR